MWFRKLLLRRAAQAPVKLPENCDRCEGAVSVGSNVNPGFSQSTAADHAPRNVQCAAIGHRTQKLDLALAFFACSFISSVAGYSYLVKSGDSQRGSPDSDSASVAYLESQQLLLQPVIAQKTQIAPVVTVTQSVSDKTGTTQQNIVSDYQEEIESLRSRNKRLRANINELTGETTGLQRELLLKELNQNTSQDDVIYKTITRPLGLGVENSRRKKNALP